MSTPQFLVLLGVIAFAGSLAARDEDGGVVGALVSGCLMGGALAAWLS